MEQMRSKLPARAFYIVGGGLTLALVVWILSPFAQVLAWAAILATIAYPAHARIRRWLGGRETLAATLSTLLVVLVILGPALEISFQVTREAIGLYQNVVPTISATLAEEPARLIQRLESLPGVGPLVRRLDQVFDMRSFDLREHLMDAARGAASGLAAFTGGLVRNLFTFLMDALVLVLTLGVLFRDGARWVAGSRYWLPMGEEDREGIVRDLRRATRAILYGMFLTALVQGVLAGIGYLIAGLQSVLLLATATTVAALVPVVGTTLVWVPAVAVLFFQGHVWRALFLLLWGVLVVTMADNFLKPLFIGGGTRLPLLWIFLGILGGIAAFGFIGLFAGPLVLVFARAFLLLARRELAGSAAPAGASSGSA